MEVYAVRLLLNVSSASCCCIPSFYTGIRSFLASLLVLNPLCGKLSTDIYYFWYHFQLWPLPFSSWLSVPLTVMISVTTSGSDFGYHHLVMTSDTTSGITSFLRHTAVRWGPFIVEKKCRNISLLTIHRSPSTGSMPLRLCLLFLAVPHVGCVTRKSP